MSTQADIDFDLSFSILKLAGVNTEQLKTDGYDIVNHVSQEDQDFERTLYWRAKRGNSVKKAIRDGDYKYLTEIVNDSILFEKLFKLDDDPSEQNDLFNTQPEKASSLKEKILEHNLFENKDKIFEFFEYRMSMPAAKR